MSGISSNNNGIYGESTRQLWRAWTASRNRVSTGKDDDDDSSSQGCSTIEETSLQHLFNVLGLFPSKSQIFEMIQCARECTDNLNRLLNNEPTSSSVSGKKYLTFGEFCLYASELKKYYKNSDTYKLKKNPHHYFLRSQKSSASAYDVFLGGSCNPTSWRQDLAIPYLKQNEITFYNPQQANWVPEMIELEHQAKQTSQLLFFVINEMTRNVVSMIEVAYLAGANRRLIVVISPYPNPGHEINGEPMSESEFTDLSTALTAVHDLVERQGLPVFGDIETALNCTTKVLRNEVAAIEDLGLTDNAQPVKLAHLQIGDKLVRVREAFDALDTNRSGRISLADIRMAFRIHAHRDLSITDLHQILSAHGVPLPPPRSGNKSRKSSYDQGNSKSQSLSTLPLEKVMIDFDHFCCIISEFKNKKGMSNAKNSVNGVGVPTNNNTIGKGNDSGMMTAGNKRVWRESGHRKKKASRILHRVAHPFQKVSSWVTSPFSSRCKTSSTSSSSSTHKTSIEKPPEVFLQPSEESSNASYLGGHLKRRGSQIRDVYLGGTMRGNRWREKVAIPLLKKHGLTYFNPLLTSSSSFSTSSGSCSSSSSSCSSSCVGPGRTTRRLIPIETAAMDNSRVLLFVILGSSRSVEAMCEAAYYIGRGATVVLCIQKMPENSIIDDSAGEVLSKAALKDYNRGRAYLSDIANREGVPVFEEIHEAIECILQKCKSLKSA